MPGGAMVSAPIVKLMGEGSDTTPEQFTASNYWWRHVWETTWPLYPSIILAAAVMKVSVWDVAIINFPISLTCIVSGFLLKPIGSKIRSREKFDALALWNSLWPILFIVILGLIFNIDIVISVLCVTAIVVIYRHIKLPVIIDGLKKGFALDMIALIFGVMTLMMVIEGTGAAGIFYEELVRAHVPAWLVVYTVPFVVGVLAGITSAYIGVGFPVVFPLIGTAALSQNAGMLLAFAGGYMGVMISPVHLCLVLTSDYFKASLWKAIFLIVIPVLLTSLISFFLAFTLYR
jgi:integral membrane protein (TIGR00529 family)